MVEEILMEQIRTYLYFMQNGIYKSRYKNLAAHLQWQRIRASLSATKIHFLERVPFFEMNRATIDRRYSNRSEVPKSSEVPKNKK